MTALSEIRARQKERLSAMMDFKHPKMMVKSDAAVGDAILDLDAALVLIDQLAAALRDISYAGYASTALIADKALAALEK